MSFQPFEKKDLPKELKNIENTFIRYNSNILRQSTVAYQDLNDRVKSSKLSSSNNRNKASIVPTSDPNTKFLQLHTFTQSQQSQVTTSSNKDQSEYLFDNRYHFRSLLTHGGFSQIILVHDHFNLDSI
jgi:hypothetical protein